MKKKFGIVSSFDILCGNATYSEALLKGLSTKYDVEKIEIPVEFQKKVQSQELKNVIDKIKKCDHINIQMELGLYGPTPSIGYKVLKKIILASKSCSITMHRVDKYNEDLKKKMYSQLKKTKSILSTLGCILHHTVSTIKGHAYKNIIKIAEKQGSSFIVHTERERKKILKINPSAKVHVYPIVWMEENSRTTDLKSQFVNPYPIIGLFGFISKYKNYELVANALIKEKFNIFIAGGTHPQSEEYGTVNSKKSSYQKILSDKFSIEQYKGRVLIKTAPSDEELITFIQSVDLVCIPYLETGQSGSGIASMAIQYGKKVIFSDNHCTTELTKFLNTKPLLFDVESPLSFISAANAALDPNYKLEFNGYNFKNLINLYATVS